MPVYNCASYLKDSIESVLNQTFTDFEFIIIDDASQDNSVEKIKFYAKNDSRIKLVQQLQNLGVAHALNKAIDLATGQWLVRMDADDICVITRFEDQVSFANKNPDIDIFGTHIELFGSQSFINRPKCDHFEILLDLFFGCPLVHPTVFIKRKSFIDHSLRYDPTVKYTEDYDLWVRASKKLKFANIPKVLLKYRVHQNSNSIKSNGKQSIDSCVSQLKMFENLGVKNKVLDEMVLIINKPAYDRSLFELGKIEKLFLSMIESNEKTQLFNSFFLREHLANRYFLACFYLTRYGFQSRKLFYQSSLSRYASLSFFKAAEFLLRSLLFIKR